MTAIKKVCIISPLGYCGIAYYDYSLCRALSESGLKVDLFSVDNYIVGEELNFNKVDLFIGTHGDISRIKKGVNYLRALIKAFFLILKKKHEIIHLQKMELPVIDCVFFILLRLAGKKIVYTPHDIIPFKYRRLRYPIYLSYKLSDAIIVHNEKNRIDLAHYFGFARDRISVIPHGNYDYFLKGVQRSEARQRIELPPDKKVLLLFGNMRKGKGIETTILSLKYLKNKADVLLLIAGKVSHGFDFEGMMKLIRNNDLEEFVLIRNRFIEDNLVESYYKSCDIVVIPYEQGYESGVLRYAFSCGLPAVVSDLKEFSEFAKDSVNCLMFRTGDPKHLAERLKVMLEDKSILQKISQNAKKLADRDWSWEKSASKTRETYEKLSATEVN